MDFLPLFFSMKGAPALVSGASPTASRKIDLLLRAGATVLWHEPDQETLATLMNDQGEARIREISLEDVDATTILFVVAAHGNEQGDAEIVALARRHNLPVNVVNNADASDFVFPSVIDRSPVIAAVSSSGELPVLTRLLRSRLESMIPHAFGRMANIAKTYRQQVKKALPGINARRRFWETQLEGRFSELVFAGREAEAKALFEEKLGAATDNHEASNDGEVYLVGAGPGDPDLLSFKALRLMRQADVVLYDRLVSAEIMKLVKQDAELINVGKERANHTLPQQSINQLLVDLAKEGKRVLRLKGGDPFIFGRGGEEIELLAENQIAFQVVPGVTAAAGCAAYSGIPLTHRDCSQSVRFITGHLKNNTSNLPWPELIHEHQTLVFYMGLASLGHIAENLMGHGMRENMPVALVSKGTTREQRVVAGTLKTIAQDAEESGIRAPTIIIVGEVVRLRERLNWRD